MLQVTCTQCGLRIHVPETVQGRRGVCFNCGQPITVPTVSGMARHENLLFEAGALVSDRYRIEKAIGKGGMGVVYRAEDTLLSETVALKFMNPRMLRTSHGKRMFIQEAQIARRLRHDNIVAVHDVNWTNEGILYLSMELAEGRSLRSYLRQRRSERRLVSVRLTVSIIAQILNALDYAHKTVVHRDLKPENVHLMPGERVKVLDFGLAKAVQAELLAHRDGPDAATATASGKPRTKHVVGTFAYAAPEQQRREAVDLRADIYAVGLLLRELLTLRTPIEKAVRVEAVRDDVSPGILDVLERALQEEREHRWQSAAAFREAIQQAFNQAYRPAESVEAVAVGGGQAGSTEGMVFFEGGSFVMGSNENRETAPENEVYVAPFWMDAHPVTVRQYAEFLEATGRPAPKLWRDPKFNGPDQPVVGVSWHDAMAYAAWCGKALPTEEQWEFAARGRSNRRYPWGNLAPDTTRCNFSGYLGMTSNVTMHDDGRSPEGLFDLAGNVFEWTQGPYAPYSILRQSPEQAEGAPRRAVRGGCWDSPAPEVTTTARKGVFPETQSNTIGFRCVRKA